MVLTRDLYLSSSGQLLRARLKLTSVASEVILICVLSSLFVRGKKMACGIIPIWVQIQSSGRKMESGYRGCLKCYIIASSLDGSQVKAERTKIE